MRFAVILIFFLGSSFVSLSQNYYFVGGMNLSSHVKNNFNSDGNVALKFRPGLHFGIVGDVQISENLFAETGVIFDQKGSRLQVQRELTTSTLRTDDKFSIYYLDVPLRIGHKIDRPNDFTFLFSGGVYGGMALFARGTYWTNVQNRDFKEEYSIPWRDLFGSSRYNYLDYGLTGNLGVAYKKFQVQLSYSKGLANLALPGRFNQCLGFSVRYQINREP